MPRLVARYHIAGKEEGIDEEIEGFTPDTPLPEIRDAIAARFETLAERKVLAVTASDNSIYILPLTNFLYCEVYWK